MQQLFNKHKMIVLRSFVHNVVCGYFAFIYYSLIESFVSAYRIQFAKQPPRYPLGFKAPASYTGLKDDELYLFNHLKFTISYHEDPSQFDGVRITGFDVHPVSIEHKVETDTVTSATKISTCNAAGALEVVNDPATYLSLRSSTSGEPHKVVYSYEVQWEKSDVEWTDRWDVYLVGSPDDDIHYFAIVNSLMIVLFLFGAVATIMIISPGFMLP